MSTPQESLGYVDTEYLRLVGAILEKPKQATYREMQISSGNRVLDIGCGPGTDTVPMAHLVGADGEVVGVDYDAAMVAEADQRAQQAGVDGWVQHRVADATDLPFEAEMFDACRSERVFQHLPAREPVLAEMMRVTRRGGRVVVLDTDWGSCNIDTPEVDIASRFLRFFTEATHRHGYSGRELYRLFKAQGFVDVTFQVFAVPVTNFALLRQITTMDVAEAKALAANVITEDELRRWRESLWRADADGLFFSYTCLVLVAGYKG